LDLTASKRLQYVSGMPRKKQPTPPIEPTKNPAAVELGRRGGEATAKRGSDYFRKIAAKRKQFKGGRPKSI
jgi:hypothetical protein